MDFVKILSAIVILTTVGILYEKYNNKYFPDDNMDKHDLVKKFLLNEENKDKPILWIHSETEINSRSWVNFYSKNTRKSNQPYINLCVESIIKYCGESFNVCLIDDNSFEKLLPKWGVVINDLANPIKTNIRKMAKLKLLKKYGGMIMPSSTIVFKDLLNLHNAYLSNNDLYCGEFINKNITSNKIEFFPSLKIMGSKKDGKMINKLVDKYEYIVSNDFTVEKDLLADIEMELNTLCKQGKINLINGKLIGTKTACNKKILIDDLMSDTHINIAKQISCLCIDNEELKRRVKYNWFLKLDKHEIFKSNTQLGRYLLISHGFDY